MLCIFSRGRHKHKHKHTTQTFLSRVSYVIVVNTFRNIALNSIHSDQSCVVWFLFHFLNGNLENWLFDLNHDQSPSFFKTNIQFYVARFRRRARKICDFIDLSPNDCIRLECVRSVGRESIISTSHWLMLKSVSRQCNWNLQTVLFTFDNDEIVNVHQFHGAT